MAWSLGRRRGAVMSHVPGLATGDVLPAPGPHPGQTAGWRALPGYVPPSAQIGAYAGSLLNQFPAIIPGVQLHSGREWGNSSWYTPTRTYLPNGTIQLTTTPNNLPGGQREGTRFGGPIGPLSAKRYQQRIAQAQIRQSGLQSMQWAQGLNLSATSE